MSDDDQGIEWVLEEIEKLEYIPEGWEENDNFLESFDVRFEPQRSRMMNAIKEKKMALDTQKIALDTQKIALDTQKTNNDSQTQLERIENKIDLILKKLDKL